MKTGSNIKFINKIGSIITTGIIASFFLFTGTANANPELANYYLGTLPTDPASIHRLAQHDVLIIGAEQAVVRRDVIDEIKRQNPDIILLAYVLSKSYDDNWQRYPQNAVYANFTVDNSCWLRDSRGNVVSDWPGQKSINMKQHCADYLINFVKNNILSQGVWDGVFWDVVTDGISHTYADVDINEDGVRDELKLADAEWIKRMAYLLQESRRQLPVKYIVINGSSLPVLQPYVNGRMYENYPTPWEAGGSWSGIMNKLLANQKTNPAPELYVFNANTNNTGRQNDYRRMRFGLASSLLADNVYYSFDYGTNDHSQLWWYDEYDVRLGAPVKAAESYDGKPQFADGVWKRDFEHGAVLINSTAQPQEVYLDGDYEKIIGIQDPAVNDGSITNRVMLAPKDGILLKKSATGNQTIADTPFDNGAFIRFYDSRGNRTQNGFFAYDEDYSGGTSVYHGDIDGLPGQERVVITGNHLEVFDSAGVKLWEAYPFGNKHKGRIELAVGKWSGAVSSDVAVASAGRVMVYNASGSIVQKAWSPFGSAYKRNLTLAVRGGQLAVGPNGLRAAEVIVYAPKLKVTKRFYPYGSGYRGSVAVALGDVNADSTIEVITASQSTRAVIRTFTLAGKRVSEFGITGLFGGQNLNIAASDNDRDGHDEILIMSRSS